MKFLLVASIMLLSFNSFAFGGDDIFKGQYLGRTKTLNDKCLAYGNISNSIETGSTKYTIYVSNIESMTEFAYASFDGNSELIQKIEDAKKNGGTINIFDKTESRTFGIQEKMLVQLNFNSQGKLVSAKGRDFQNLTYLNCIIE